MARDALPLEGRDLHICPHPLDERMPALGVRLVWHEVHHADPGHMAMSKKWLWAGGALV